MEVVFSSLMHCRSVSKQQSDILEKSILIGVSGKLQIISPVSKPKLTLVTFKGYIRWVFAKKIQFIA